MHTGLLFHPIRPDCQRPFSNGALYLGVFRSHDTLDSPYDSSMGCAAQRLRVGTKQNITVPTRQFPTSVRHRILREAEGRMETKWQHSVQT